MKRRPYILSIAGFDPTGGAGILADVKTFERHKCVGMAVQTANTNQTENEFLKTNWVEEDQVLEQLKVLLNRYAFLGIKIGLIPSINFLNSVTTMVREMTKNVSIVWDPVLSASAGFDFGHDLSLIEGSLVNIDWITPNWNEAKQIGDSDDAKSGMAKLSLLTNVYLKGGHNAQKPGTDYILIEGKVQVLNPKPGKYYKKHGSGCVFSSAFVANLIQGYPPRKAALRAKRYVEQFLKSNPGLLGRHYG